MYKIIRILGYNTPGEQKKLKIIKLIFFMTRKVGQKTSKCVGGGGGGAGAQYVRIIRGSMQQLT